MNRTSPLAGLPLAFLISAIWVAGCGADGDTNNGNGPPPGGNKPDAGFGGKDSGSQTDSGSRGDGGPQDFCSGTGSAIPLPSGDLCTGDLGRKLFRFAACSCTTMDVGGALITDSFNSTTQATKRNGGSIGANEKLTTMGVYNVGGSIYAGTQGLVGSGGGQITNDVYSAGDVNFSGVTSVGRDVYSSGNVMAAGVATAKGKLNLAAGRTAGGLFSAAETVPLATPIPTPCDCSNKLDIPGIVASMKTVNDNAKIGLSEDALANGGSVTLPCGRYYLSAINGAGVSKIRAEGRVALFVAGDFNESGVLQIELVGGAEIDIFVTGNVSISGASQFGSVDAPSKVRMYAGGTQFNVNGAVGMGGNFYAPYANITLPGAFAMSGSIFGQKLNMPGAFTIHYDEAVLDLQGCRPPSNQCSSCNDCGSGAPACKGGTCGACTQNSDCCSPLVCVQGSCVTDIIR